MDNAIKRTDIMLFVFWLVYFMPLALLRSVKGIEMLGVLIRSPIVLMALYSSYKNWIVCEARINRFWIYIVALFIWNLTCVLVNSPGKFGDYLLDIYQLFEMIIVLCYSFRQRGKDAYRALYYVALIYVYANFLTLMIFPEGMFTSSAGSIRSRVQWLFGSKNNIPIYITLFSFVVLIQERRRATSKLFAAVTILVSIYSSVSAGDSGRMFMEGSSTGIVTGFLTICTAFLCLIFSSKKNVERFALLSIKKIILITTALNIILLGGVSIPVIKTLVVDVLGKNLTFTNRTFVWANALEYICRAPFIGHGLKTIVLFTNGATSTYSFVLGLLKSCGIPSVLLLVLCLLLIPYSSKRNYQIFLIGLFEVFINGLMSQVDLKFVLFFAISLFFMAKNTTDAAMASDREMSGIQFFSQSIENE